MRILSGINPSSSKGLHIGNYYGAVKRFVELQESGECYYFVANLHSLNTVFSPHEASDNCLNVFAEYLAFGIDPVKSVFFVESDVPEIPYLQTILNNSVTVAELQRMHGYKDKLAKDVEISGISAGLFEYPVLMAADILLFNTDVVPVGEDQTQHVEICREMARTFNNRYGEVLKVPEVSVQKSTARVLGIDGVRKMSKSLGNDIPVFATEEVVRKQIMSITTDPARIRPTDPGDPAKNVCFSYLELFAYSKAQIAELKDRYRNGTIGDVEIKQLVYEQFMAVFKPFREKKIELMSNSAKLLELRQEGAHRARLIAQETIAHVREACGV